jgi:hypothetical protein
MALILLLSLHRCKLWSLFLFLGMQKEPWPLQFFRPKLLLRLL